MNLFDQLKIKQSEATYSFKIKEEDVIERISEFSLDKLLLFVYYLIKEENNIKESTTEYERDLILITGTCIKQHLNTKNSSEYKEHKILLKACESIIQKRKVEIENIL